MSYDTRDLILLNMAGIGFLRFEKIRARYPGLKRAIKAGKENLCEIEGIGPKLAEKICSMNENDIIKEEKLMKAHKAYPLSFFDEGYPENLKNIYDPPLLLYIKGEFTAADKLAIALVGSRKASLYGIDTCRRLSGSLANMGFTVVSGLARGIDSAAHKGALLERGRTIAVLGSGIGDIYPLENRKLAQDIADSGALVSEFPMAAPPLRHHFPMRNRIISGLSLGTVIVEAAQKSGALITASCALEQGREVFAVPGRALSTASSGVHRLIKDGAKLVHSVEDILEELNVELRPIAKSARGEAPSNRSEELDGPERSICDIVSDEPIYIDEIMEASKLPASEVARSLLSLEMKKLVKELPGKNYVSV
ncbi:MAG: DNA-processing protein DprA [Candidatus Omnitrophota bacterium]